MKFTRREEKRGDRLFDVSDRRRERTSPHRLAARGGADQCGAPRMAAASGSDFCTATTKSARPRRAGRITRRSWATSCTGSRTSALSTAGRKFAGGTHSFLRGKVWHFVETEREGELTYRITPDDFSPTEYPLRVSLDLTYRIEGARISIAFKFRNDEPELTAHVGFGLHPGFAATSFDSFRFEMPAGLYRRHFSPTNYLSGETEDIRFAGGEMPFAKDKLPGLLHSGIGRCPGPHVHLHRSADRTNGCDRSHRRSLSDVVVRWRTVSLRRAVLGPDRSPRTARLRGQGRHPDKSLAGQELVASFSIEPTLL